MDGNGVLGETRDKLNSLSICDEKDRGNAKQGYGRSSDTDSPSCSSDKTAQFKTLIADARQMVTEEKLHDALELYEKALSLCYSDKLANRITKLKAFIKENIQTENHITTKERNSPVKSGRILSSGSENRQASSIATDQEGISEEEERRFRKLLSTSKELTAQGRIQEALELNKIALTICHSDKLAKRIAKMEEYLGEKDQEGSKDHCTDNVSEVQSSREDSSTQDSSSVTQQRFTELISDAKMHTHNGEIQEALKKYKTALSLCYSEKLEKRIQKIQEYLDQNKEKDKSSPTEQATENDSEGQTSSSRTGSQGELSSGEQERFNKLVMEAKKLTSDGEVRAALEKNKEALKIFYSEKLQKRITKMEAYLSEYENKGESDEEDGGMVHIGNEFYIYKDLANKLYSHQRAGVLWMWGLHQKKKGGILGDDMGLGKTIQVISFLSGLFDMERCHSVLIVMPVSVIVNWEKEFTKWAPGINIEAFHGSSKKEKERALTKVQRRGGVLLTSYGLVVTSWEMLSRQNGREYKWDYLILDEGHKIKNPTKTTKAVHQVGAKNRIILTGTPIQNNLRELWALFDFVHQGSLLGTARTFKMEYENPITRARERDATAGERRLGLEMAESLKKIIAPYFLRRTKAEVLKDEKEPQESNKAPAAKMPSLTRKNDFIVWLYLTEAQQRIYSDFLSLDTVKELLMTKKSPLVALNVLKKICDHPRLLSTRACAQLGLDGEDRLDDSDLESEAGFQCAVNQIKNMQDEVLINESGKLIVVVELLDKNKAEGHRTLLFSQSRKMLDIIQQVITNRGHKVMRLDGTVTHLSDRDQRIQKFQTDQSYSVFLLTTQVGGVGLTLTAADRVVIYDPSWNPATDAQAVDRVFRIGQDKNVVIYRLITCGTVEEKIYRRQVFKDSITRQTTGNSKNPYRYFTKQELRELFTLDNPRYSKTQQQLEEMHSGHRNTDSSLDAHVAFLYSLEIFGLSDHDLMFTNEKCDIDYDDDDVGGADVEDGNDYIQHRVQKAQELLKMESELSQDFNDRVSKYPRNIDVGDQAGPRRPVSQPWSNWTMEGMVNISKENDGGSDTGVKKEVKNDEGCIDLTTIHHNSNEEEVIDLSSPVPSPVKVKAEPTVKVEHTDAENSAEKISNHISEDVFPKIKTEKESPGKISESEVYSMKVEPESHSDTDVNDDQLSMTGSDDNKSVPTDSSTDSEDESEGLDDPLSMSQTENNIMASNENDAADHETVHSPNVQLSMSGSEQGVTGPGTTENVSNPRLSKSDSDDDKMNNSLSREKSFVIKESIQGSNMSQDKNLESEAVNNNKTYTPKHSHVQEMSSPKSQTRTKTPKSRRKSVSASPWLKNTPKKGHQDVIEEELLISPDGRHPLISSKRTISSSSDVSPCKSVNLNSTILSVFGESPVPHKLSNRSKVGSHLCSNSNLGMTFIEESPVGDKVSDQVYKTVVENSPGYSANRSRTSSDDVVFDSPESKSTSRKSELLNNNSSSVGETDDESSPKKSKSDGRHNVDNSDDDINDKVPNSDDENTEKVLDSDKEDTNSEINKRRSVKSSDLRADNHMTESDQDSDDSLPCLSRKTLQKKRYAVIESDDDEDNDLEDDEGSVEQDSDDEMKEDDGKPTESAQTRDKMNNQVIISSNEEDNVDSGNRVHRNAYVEGSDEEELEDEEGSDMSGFIVDDDDEEEETEEEEEESEEEEDDEKSAFDDLPRKMKVQYQQYMKNGRSLYKSGEYNEALANFLQALEIFPDPALQAMALKCHQKMN